MPKYSVIVFDLGNVIIQFDYHPVLEKFNEIEAGLGDKFSQLYRDNYHIHREFEKGLKSEEEFLSVMISWLEHKVSKKEFIRIFSDIFTVNQNVADLIPELKKKYKLVLLSNTNSIHRKYGYGNNGFLKSFDKLFLSHEVGAVKPEEKIYRAVEAYTQRPSSEHFFIDDIPEYIEGAKKCGWDGIQFVSYENLVVVLKEKKIL